jgi:hypothetical protein
MDSLKGFGFFGKGSDAANKGSEEVQLLKSRLEETIKENGSLG